MVLKAMQQATALPWRFLTLADGFPWFLDDLYGHLCPSKHASEDLGIIACKAIAFLSMRSKALKGPASSQSLRPWEEEPLVATLRELIIPNAR